MPAAGQSSGSLTWLFFALLTAFSWGVYGILLHRGQLQMADPVNGRIKAFLFVGIAYFLTAVLAPLAVLLVNKASWDYPQGGVLWSLIAGVSGAVGAFCVLLAFGAKGSPAVVMSIIFAGAPVINALVAIAMDRAWAELKWPFVLGIAMAAVGGTLVTLYKPPPKKHLPAPAATSTPATPADSAEQRR